MKGVNQFPHPSACMCGCGNDYRNMRKHAIKQRELFIAKVKTLETKLAAAEAEVNKWKDEYENLCKFTTDLEDKLKEKK